MELLVVIVVVVIIVAVAMPMIGNIHGIAKRTTAKQNAKLVEQMSKALGALGVAHVIPDSMGGVEATARLLREGITIPDGPMAGERFILSGMRDSDIEEIAKFLQVRYEENYLRLMYIEPDDNVFADPIDGAGRMLCALAGRFGGAFAQIGRGTGFPLPPSRIRPRSS